MHAYDVQSAGGTGKVSSIIQEEFRLTTVKFNRWSSLISEPAKYFIPSESLHFLLLFPSLIHIITSHYVGMQVICVLPQMLSDYSDVLVSYL